MGDTTYPVQKFSHFETIVKGFLSIIDLFYYPDRRFLKNLNSYSWCYPSCTVGSTHVSSDVVKAVVTCEIQLQFGEK